LVASSMMIVISKEALNVVEVKMQGVEAAIMEVKMVRDLKEVITVTVKMEKDRTEVVFETEAVVIITEEVIIEVGYCAAEKVIEGGVGRKEKNKMTHHSE